MLKLTFDELFAKVSYGNTCVSLIEELVKVTAFDVKDHHDSIS